MVKQTFDLSFYSSMEKSTDKHSGMSACRKGTSSAEERKARIRKHSHKCCIVTFFTNEEGNISAKRFPNSHKINWTQDMTKEYLSPSSSSGSCLSIADKLIDLVHAYKATQQLNLMLCAKLAAQRQNSGPKPVTSLFLTIKPRNLFAEAQLRQFKMTL